MEAKLKKDRARRNECYQIHCICLDLLQFLEALTMRNGHKNDLEWLNSNCESCLPCPWRFAQKIGAPVSLIHSTESCTSKYGSIRRANSHLPNLLQSTRKKHIKRENIEVAVYSLVFRILAQWRVLCLTADLQLLAFWLKAGMCWKKESHQCWTK